MSASAIELNLHKMKDALGRARFPLALPGAQEARKAADGVIAQLGDYVLPRLETLDAPLLAVVGGSTGAGKSTLVNSLIGRVVTTPGVIRPTTRSPVLVHHPDDEHWFSGDRILPGLVRSKTASHDTNSLQLVAEQTLPKGLAILDAPDVDSVVAENRVLAAQLLSAADLWLFLTSAARYADAVPWDYLLEAQERNATVAVVLDRVPPGAMQEVPTHLGQMMTERGLAESPLFAVPETSVDDQGILPPAAVAPIRQWLAALAADEASRQQVIITTLDGAIGDVTRRATVVADGVRDQAAALTQLETDAEMAFAEGVRRVEVQSGDGTLLRGEVLARWHDFVGTGEFMRAVENKVSWLRDRVFAAFKGVPIEANQVQAVVESELEALIRSEAELSVDRAWEAWQESPAGRAVLAETGPALSMVSPKFGTEVGRLVRDWQGGVLELVANEGMQKRSKARALAFGANGLGAALMIVIFASTGGLTGAEIGVAGGATVLAQRLLEAVFGDGAIRQLAEVAKDDLDRRVAELYTKELDRYRDLLDGMSVPAELPDEIDSLCVVISMDRRGGYGGDANRIVIEAPPPEVTDTAEPVAAQLPDADELELEEAEIVDGEIPSQGFGGDATEGRHGNN